MTTIVTRSGKGSPLKNNEVDANFTNINSGKLEASSNLSDVASAATARTNLDVDQAGLSLAFSIALG